MSDLSDMMQGKFRQRKLHVKDQDARQLDLFASLADRSAAPPKLALPNPPPAAEPRPQPELVLPPAGAPPDVTADVRAVLSEAGQTRRIEITAQPPDAGAALRTGVYHRKPRAPIAPPASAVPRRAGAEPASGVRRLRAWLAGIEVDRRLVSLVVVLAVLVGALAYWTARPRREAVPAETAHASAGAVPAAEIAPAQPAAGAPPAAVAPPAVPAEPMAGVVRAPDWKIPGTEVVQNGGAYFIRFTDPVFESGDRISIKGMEALKAVGARLAALKAGARVVVTGFTDNVPLAKPTDQYQSNADIAAARAKAAVDHLAAYARANKGLAFEAQAGAEALAPYPNDTLQNRRLNRTVTVQVVPVS